MISIALVDDHQIMLDGLKSVFEGNSNFMIIGAVNNAGAAIDLVLNKRPDVVLMDINMPGMDGITATKVIKEKSPATKVVILSMNNDMESITKASIAGAEGYILKNAGVQEIQNAVTNVAQGMTYYSHEVSDVLIEGIKKERASAELAKGVKEEINSADKLLALLSKKERVVLKMLLDDRKMADISEELGRSEFTIITHKKSIFKKLEVKSLASLIKLCYDIGVLDLLNQENI